MENSKTFTEEDSEFLVEVVKEAQKRKIVGAHGLWHHYLIQVVDKNPRAAKDPAKRPWHVLAGFLASFTREEDKQMVEHMREKHRTCKTRAEVLWLSSPEQELVELTRRDPNYKRYFSFPSHLKNWVVLEQGKASDASTPERMLSLDCEMGIGEDNNRHLVKLCVVDRNCQVLLDTFVKPEVHIKDYLTDISGVTAADVDSCEFSLADAQRKLQELVQPGMILVGHSLSCDLKVLQVDYPRVIDTHLIFKTREGRRFGLNDLCQAVLGYSCREEGKAHNCVFDAVIPMKLVQHVLDHGLGLLEIPDNMSIEPSLFIHKLPMWASPSILRRLFPSNIPCDIKMIPKVSSGTQHARIHFQSVEHSNKAFDKLTGKRGADSNGVPQKEVKLPQRKHLVQSHSVFVRKVQSVQSPIEGVDVNRPPNLVSIEETENRTSREKRPLHDVVSGEDGTNGVQRKGKKMHSKKHKV